MKTVRVSAKTHALLKKTASRLGISLSESVKLTVETYERNRRFIERLSCAVEKSRVPPTSEVLAAFGAGPEISGGADIIPADISVIPSAVADPVSGRR